jgi:hypothetical protein
LKFGVTAHQKYYREIFNPLNARLYGSFMLKIYYLSKQGNIMIITRLFLLGLEF